MAVFLEYSGVLYKNNLFRKLNFQDPNASISNYLAGLSTEVKNGFKNFA